MVFSEDKSIDPSSMGLDPSSVGLCFDLKQFYVFIHLFIHSLIQYIYLFIHLPVVGPGYVEPFSLFNQSG